MEPSTSSPAAETPAPRRSSKVRMQRKSLLEELQRTLDMLRDDDLGVSLSEEGTEAPDYGDSESSGSDNDDPPGSPSGDDHENDQMFDLLKSRCESPEFLQKIDKIQKSAYQTGAVEQDTSWDIIKAVDVCDDDSDDGYVLVKPDDAADGIAFFVATYLLSLSRTKELAPEQLLKALKKTFSTEKRKRKLRKAWDGTKVIYNVASCSATAFGIYNNQAILKVATTAFGISWRVISKFL